MRFTKRNESGLHCRFCGFGHRTSMYKIDLYETSPIKGIVCGSCMSHLKDYLRKKSPGDKRRRK